jgi:uncharacterized protein YeaO (DUF488 family)
MVKLKRAYEPASRGDGYRVLVERLWPRGIRKDELALDEWRKEVAPSGELRKWFNHDPKRWREFKLRYLKELKETAAAEQLRALGELAAARTRSFSRPRSSVSRPDADLVGRRTATGRTSWDLAASPRGGRWRTRCRCW